MYAVLKSVGKQFKVSPGDVLKIDKIEGNVGDTISFKDIVAVGNGDKFELGSPDVKGAEVSANYCTKPETIRLEFLERIEENTFKELKVIVNISLY